MEEGDYHEGLRLLRTAAGADRFKMGFEQGFGDYSPSTGIGHLDQIKEAARGVLDENGERSYDRQNYRQDPAALVFLGAEEEFKGFVERRTGKSPDYRAQGFVNHLGQAISRYRDAERLGYPVATWRLDALMLKLGNEDFRHVETSYNEAKTRSLAYSTDLRDQVLSQLGAQQPGNPQTNQGETPEAGGGASVPQKSGGCYIATAVYGSYDAPPVLTLRDFRDRRLATTPMGRGFIRIYYAASPTLARHFGRGTMLGRAGLVVLDRIVRSLQEKGYTGSFER